MNPLVPSFNSPSVWGAINESDKRIYIVASRSTVYGLLTLIQKLIFKDRRTPKQLIQDYWDSKLDFVYIGASTRDKIIQEIDRSNAIDHYSKLGYSGYNSDSPRKYFIFIEPFTLVGINTNKVVIKVGLKRKSGKGKQITIGLFEDYKSAKQWAKDHYKDYDKKAVDRVVSPVNKLTRDFFSNPILQDPLLIEGFKKLL